MKKFNVTLDFAVYENDLENKIRTHSFSCGHYKNRKSDNNRNGRWTKYNNFAEAVLYMENSGRKMFLCKVCIDNGGA